MSSRLARTERPSLLEKAKVCSFSGSLLCCLGRDCTPLGSPHVCSEHEAIGLLFRVARVGGTAPNLGPSDLLLSLRPSMGTLATTFGSGANDCSKSVQVTSPHLR